MRRGLGVAAVMAMSFLSVSSYGQVGRGDRYSGAPWATRSPVIAEHGMAATEQPLASLAAVDILKKGGAGRLKFLGLIAAPEGIEAVRKAHPDVTIHVGAIDSHLNAHAYIVPGLGDAGDRLFGTK